MHDPDRRPSPLAAGPPWWAWPLLLPGPLLAWHACVESEMERSASALPFAPSAIAWIGVAGFACALVVETLVYGMLWAARGRRLPFASSVLVLLQLSMIDRVALAIGSHVPEAGAARALACVLAGSRATWVGAAPDGVSAALGSLGVLTLARMALWAWVQAEGTGRRWREAASMVALVWAGSHVVQGLVAELARGRSVVS